MWDQCEDRERLFSRSWRISPPNDTHNRENEQDGYGWDRPTTPEPQEFLSGNVTHLFRQSTSR